MIAKPMRIAAVVAVAATALAACGGGGGSSSGGSGGGGSALIIGTDLPLQGTSKDTSEATNHAIQLYLDSIGGKVGGRSVKLQTYDDSTAAKGAWDDATCAKNAQDHVSNTNEIAVMGTYNSGCAKIEVPTLNQDPDGPMLMVSHANTNVGLTKKWDAGEPQKFFPSGQRSYARVVTTDDVQGSAGAAFAAQTLKVKRCFVLNDNQTYGQGVAKVFAEAAPKLGIKILGNQPWDVKQSNYTALFQSVKATNPDCVFLAGIYDENGGQVVKDKVAVLGDNTKVKLIGPDGFQGYPALDAQPEAQGMYATFAGLATEALLKQGGAGATLAASYQKKYGKQPPNYALYGVAAVQVIIAAIEKSDGTRKGVTEAVFSGEGITIPKDKSVLGKEIKIDPATGDTTAKDVSVLQLRNHAFAFVKAQGVS